MIASSLDDQIELLGEVLELGAGRLDEAHLAAARTVRANAEQRLRRGDHLVVAALCGGTGTGKSSLFNALAGAELSLTGIRRPVTTAPVALTVGEESGAGALLDWLRVSDRHPVGARRDLPPGLVLLDLPDQDSVVAQHRERVDGLVDRVDVLVWVVDPLKYAQRRLHDDYLDDLAEHAEVVVLVMNRSDELSREDLDACLADLRGLLAERGLARARVLATSTRTGRGVDELRELLATEVRRRTAVAARLQADLRITARRLLSGTGPPVGGRLDDAQVVTTLAGHAGVERIADGAAREYVRAAREATRPVGSAVLAALIARLLTFVRGARDLLGVSTRRPEKAAAPSLTVRHALVALVEQVAGDLPAAWRRRLHTAAGGDARQLVRSVTGAVDQVSLRPARRRWWAAVRAALTGAELLVVIGALWLLVLGVLGWLQLPDPPLPRLGDRLPLPTLLLLGGAVLRGALGVGRRRWVGRGAQRQREAVAERLRQAVANTVEREVLRPLRAEVDAHDLLRDALERLAG